MKDGVSETGKCRRMSAMAVKRDGINASRLSRIPATMGSGHGKRLCDHIVLGKPQFVSYLTDFPYAYRVTVQIALVSSEGKTRHTCEETPRTHPSRRCSVSCGCERSKPWRVQWPE
ncbi:hypothetical protein NSPZN2_100407 [Nitrospira defluvii]|uniref:Uncharacterized protein n=1 Tax=Nitrospira defluvii TaxID=330214 RepID=A0ABM8R4H7_9BACT|nr:hypothetical protein NSPZN2_100407 [Nitrospira defluvii]